MQVVLVMFRSDGERRSFSVVRNLTIIGRRENCDLRIPVSDVSRKHCRLVRTDEGIRIEDLGSSNGTYVNGNRIQESDLNAGDVLGIGPVLFTVQIDGVPDEDDMEPPTVEQFGHPAEGSAPTEEYASGAEELEELPVEENFAIEEESPLLEEEPVAELEELPVEASAPLEEPVMDLEELPAEHAEVPLPELEELPAAPQPPAEDELDFEELPAEEPLASEPPLMELEELPAEPQALEEAPPHAQAMTPLEDKPPQAAEVPSKPAMGQIPLDDFEDLALEDSPAPSPAAAMPAVTSEPPAAEPVALEPQEIEPVEAEMEELEFDEAHLSGETPIVAPNGEASPDHLEGELELDESALEPAAPEATAPAPEQINLESTGEEFEELSLDDTKSEKAVGESAWDFVIEETDASREHHDIKLDLDSPHQ